MKRETFVGLIALSLIGCSSSPMLINDKPVEAPFKQECVDLSYHPDSGLKTLPGTLKTQLRIDTVLRAPKVMHAEAFATSGGCNDKRTEMIGNDWQCFPCANGRVKDFEKYCESGIFRATKCSSPEIVMLRCFK